jgi:large subunit ribosomal protein L25
MAETLSFIAETRAKAGRGPARALRRQSKVPVIVYGGADEPMMLAMPIKEIRRQIQGNPGFYSSLIDLEVDGRKMRVLPREAQLHPVSGDPIHIDFLRAGEGARVTVEVPVVFLNELASPGLKRGGVLNIVRREIELSCPVESIPAQIEIDLTGLEIGESVHISRVELPAGVRPTITDRDFTICGVTPPTKGAEDNTAGAETPAAAS